MAELDPQLTQPDRHPFPTVWSLNGTLDDVIFRFYWSESVPEEARRVFEQILNARADELSEKDMIHYLEPERWRTRTRPKGVAETTPRAHKIAIYADFVTGRETENLVDEIEPLHQLLDALHNFTPLPEQVKVEIGI